MRTLLAIVLLAVAAQAQSPTPVVKAGALSCYAVRRTPPATAPTTINVQSYCYSGTILVSNFSSLAAKGGSTIVTHTFGPGCMNQGLTPKPPQPPGGCDTVVWAFTDFGGGVINYQVAANTGPLLTSTLP